MFREMSMYFDMLLECEDTMGFRGYGYFNRALSQPPHFQKTRPLG